MAKRFKNREEKTKTPSEALETEPSLQLIDELDVLDTVLAPEPEAQERIWGLHDAARQMIKDYKDSWWPSIHKMAHTMDVKDNAPESQCRDLFLKWGANLK